MSFVETRFPEDIAYGSSGGPEYSTDIVTTHAGYEQRNSNWQYARRKWNISHGIKTQTQLDALIAFFHARKGQAHGFRFKDWGDYQANGVAIATADGTETDFQLAKHYTNGGITEVRPITKPVAGSVSVYLDSMVQESGWSVDTSTGIVSFSVAPANGVIISADFEFDVPVRFATDYLNTVLDNYNSHRIPQIELTEVRV